MLCPACGSENIDGSDRCENCLAPFRDLDVPRADAAEGLARSVMEDNLSQLDQVQTITVAPETPAIEVARLMKDARQGCALVLDGNKLVGIFTEHDVLLRMTDVEKLRSVEVQDVDLVEGPAPAIPVEGIPIQDLPFNDIPLEEIRAEEAEVVEQTPITVSLVAGLSAAYNVPVRDLMSPNPETLHEHDSVAAALNKMSLGRYRHLPIRKNDGSYTVTSIKSVLNYIAQEDW